jgi:hypothetical protein
LDADVADFYADVAIAAKDVQAFESLAGSSSVHQS